MSNMNPRSPTVFVSWAHSDEGWSSEQAAAWGAEVQMFCILLRSLGIDAEADVFHFHEAGIDWNHFGPREIADRDFTIVVLSPAWKQRWEGRNSPDTGAGAVAEANELHGLFNSDQGEFREKVVLVRLPMVAGEDVVPNTLSGVQRVSISEISPDGLDDLVRLLTRQPKHPLPPLGEIPILPPDPPPSTSIQPPGRSAGPVGALEISEIDREIGALREALARIPEPQAGEGPHLPWYRAWHGVANELDALERRRTQLIESQAQPSRTTTLQGDPTHAVVSPTLPTPTMRELREKAPTTPGAPDHWMLFDGLLLLRFVLSAAPPRRWGSTSQSLKGALEAAADAAVDFAANNWPPNAPILILDEFTRSWKTKRPGIWEAGHVAFIPGSPRASVAAALDSIRSILAIDRTFGTAVPPNEHGGGYFAAYDSVIAAELTSALILGAHLIAGFDADEVDFGVQISAAPSDHGLVSAESYAPASNPFRDPDPLITPNGSPAPTHFSDVARLDVQEVIRDPVQAARSLLDPWLATFRNRDVFDSIYQDQA
jgi:hypothetical protein